MLDKKEFKTNNYSFLPSASFSNVKLKEDVITFDLTIHDNYNILTKLLVLITDSKDNVLSKISMDDGLIIGRNKNQSFTGLWPNSTYTLSVVADYQTSVEKIRNEIIAEQIIKTDSFPSTPQASISNISTSGSRVTFNYEIQDRYKILTDLSIVLLSIEIPTTITEIGDFQFLGFENITSVSIPNSVTTIGKNAFYNCRDLTSIFIPRSVTYVGEEAFVACGYNSSTAFVINCEIASKPNGWDSQWLGHNGDDARIIVNWGYLKQE